MPSTLTALTSNKETRPRPATHACQPPRENEPLLEATGPAAHQEEEEESDELLSDEDAPISTSTGELHLFDLLPIWERVGRAPGKEAQLDDKYRQVILNCVWEKLCARPVEVLKWVNSRYQDSRKTTSGTAETSCEICGWQDSPSPSPSTPTTPPPHSHKRRRRAAESSPPAYHPTLCNYPHWMLDLASFEECLGLLAEHVRALRIDIVVSPVCTDAAMHWNVGVAGTTTTTATGATHVWVPVLAEDSERIRISSEEVQGLLGNNLTRGARLHPSIGENLRRAHGDVCVSWWKLYYASESVGGDKRPIRWLPGEFV